MKIPEKQPPVRRGGIHKGAYCHGCGQVSTGVHLDRELLPQPPKETN